MPVSPNPNYRVNLNVWNSSDDSGNTGVLSIIANVPENFMISTGSQWEARYANVASIKNLIENNVPGLAGKAAGAAMFATNLDPIVQSLTFQSWQSSAPIEFNMTLLFDAYQDPVKEVVYPMSQLQAISLPYNSQDNQDILIPPGPSPVSPWRSRCSIRIGRWMYIHSVIIKYVNNTFDTRYDINGNPISGQSEITFATINTPSRQDVSSFYVAIGNQENQAYGVRQGIAGTAR